MLRKSGGATNLAMYRDSRDKKYQGEAIQQLTEALKSWELYTGNALKQSDNPLWTSRVGYVDWVKLTGEVKNDIEIARKD